MPRVLDLFCGAGGCSEGYSRAGFDVVGMDMSPQKRYPFKFYCGDAVEWLSGNGVFFPGLHWDDFDLIHASPPCQKYSLASWGRRNEGYEYPDLVGIVRELLEKTGKPYVIENVPQAPLVPEKTINLCGTMFGLGVFRHRKFESNLSLVAPAHTKHQGKIGDGKYFSIAGGAGRWKSWGTVHRNVSKGTVTEWREAMGVDWMTRKELTQAIPPAYTEYIGRQIYNETM